MVLKKPKGKKNPTREKQKNKKKEKEKTHQGRADFLKIVVVMRFLMLFRRFLGFVLCFVGKLLAVVILSL
jgi:hypothetical protein